MFLESGRVEEVDACVEEAMTLFPGSYQALYLKGRVRQMQQQFSEAKAGYLAALSVCATHLPSIRQMALVYKAEGNLRMAEKMLRDLVRVDPLDHLTWHALGRVLCEVGDVG